MCVEVLEQAAFIIAVAWEPDHHELCGPSLFVWRFGNQTTTIVVSMRMAWLHNVLCLAVACSITAAHVCNDGRVLQ